MSTDVTVEIKAKPVKVESITIIFQGNKKFRQALVDRIYKVLMDDEFMADSAKPGCGYTFNSTIEPSDIE